MNEHNGVIRATPEENHELLKSHGAQIEALRLAVIALASQADGSRLLAHYDAACEVTLAHRQATPQPDDYLATLEWCMDLLRTVLAGAADTHPAQ